MDVGSLWDFTRFHLHFGVRGVLSGHMDYVRCAEYPLVFKHLAPQRGGLMLDVGSGHSHFPLYVASRTPTVVVALDPSPWVLWQHHTATRFARRGLVPPGRLRVVLGDGQAAPFQSGLFDYISAISTIEHVEGKGDSTVMQELGRVLRPGGRLVLTVPYNYERYRDFWITEDSYTTTFRGAPVFYQRHYDDHALGTRLIEPSGLRLVDKVIFGEPGLRCFNTLFANPRLPVLLKAPYLWLTPLFARQFLRVLRGAEIRTKENLPMITTEGALLVLEKPVRQ
jgi:SAM-dependent methyltransferase